jgi:hypothetical protein
VACLGRRRDHRVLDGVKPSFGGFTATATDSRVIEPRSVRCGYGRPGDVDEAAQLGQRVVDLVVSQCGDRRPAGQFVGHRGQRQMVDRPEQPDDMIDAGRSTMSMVRARTCPGTACGPSWTGRAVLSQMTSFNRRAVSVSRNPGRGIDVRATKRRISSYRTRASSII